MKAVKLLSASTLASTAFQNRYAQEEAASKAFAETKKLIKDSLFEIPGLSVEGLKFKFTVSEPTVSTQVDVNKLKTEYPEVYAAVLMEVSKDGSLRITKK